MNRLHEIIIKSAIADDHRALTSIAFEAKGFWNYPKEYYEIWRNELTITEDYIKQNIVNIAIQNDTMVGFYSVVENSKDFWSGNIFVEKGFWLEHIFIKPEYHKLGIGRLLINHVKEIAREKGIDKLLVFVDPNAKGFYDKIGARYVKESPSSIEGRMIPVYEIQIKST